MCRTYNTIGSFTSLRSHLDNNKIHDFKSLEDIVDFQNSYAIYRQQIISYHEDLIEQEKNTLHSDLQQLDIEIVNQTRESEQKLKIKIDKLKQQLHTISAHIPTNALQKFTKSLKRWYYKSKIRQNEENFDFKVKKSTSKLLRIQQTKSNRYEFIISRFDDAVKQSALQPLTEIDRKKSILDSLNSLIYGALGEQKVVKTLEVLSDEYFLINDFSISLSPQIYNRQENDYIKSVQIDHLLIAPSGIFLIETKNWSEKSQESLNLRSPVQQIKRTSFVLFKLLNNKIRNHSLHLDKHHWGDKKISVRNLLVLTNTKPKEEFQYVKTLTLKELLRYINYFKPIFSSIETQRIADFLLKTNNQKTISTK